MRNINKTDSFQCIKEIVTSNNPKDMLYINQETLKKQYMLIMLFGLLMFGYFFLS